MNDRYSFDDVEEAIRTLPKGWISEDSAPIDPGTEYWQGALGPGTAMLVGPSSAGKTTISCGLGYAFATGTSFFGRQIIEPMGVAHILGEGASGVARRYSALRFHTGANLPLPIAWKHNTADLFNKKSRLELIAELAELNAYQKSEFDVWLRVVFFDTARTNWQFRDENDNPSWSRVVQHLQEFANAINGLAIATHHPPKSGIGESGGGAGRAGLDYILTASCNRNDETGEVSNRKFAVTKHRDGETGIISAFELKKVALGIMDAFGQEATSVVAIPSDAPTTATIAKSENHTVVTFRRAFDEALQTHGREHTVFNDGVIPSPTVMAAPVEAVRQEFYRRYATGDSDESKAQATRRQAFNRALKTLVHQYGREVLSDGEEILWRL
jgi:hypothetical protein